MKDASLQHPSIHLSYTQNFHWHLITIPTKILYSFLPPPPPPLGLNMYGTETFWAVDNYSLGEENLNWPFFSADC
jgi:hypothetical protein